MRQESRFLDVGLANLRSYRTSLSKISKISLKSTDFIANKGSKLFRTPAQNSLG